MMDLTIYPEPLEHGAQMVSFHYISPNTQAGVDFCHKAADLGMIADDGDDWWCWNEHLDLFKSRARELGLKFM